MGTHPIFESDFDCLTEQKKMSEIVYAAGEGPTTPRMKGAPAQVELKKTGMSRAKTWTEEAEENFRFQEAGFLDGREYESLFPTHQVDCPVGKWSHQEAPAQRRKLELFQEGSRIGEELSSGENVQIRIIDPLSSSTPNYYYYYYF